MQRILIKFLFEQEHKFFSLNSMKRIFLCVLLSWASVQGFSQVDTAKPPYLRFPNFPNIKLLLPDHVSYFTKDNLEKKKPVMVMVFNPSCDHCQHETDEIIKHMDELKHFQIVMVTMMPFDSMLHFRKKYGLEKYKNIVTGQDFQYYLAGFYLMRNLPFLAFYDRKKKLISVFEGSMPIKRVIGELKKGL